MKKIKLIKKQKSSQSTKWMQRHLNDEYVIKSKVEGFRSRSSAADDCHYSAHHSL